MQSESSLPAARAFWDLRVYEHARALQTEILKLTKSFPADEKFSLIDQIRRSSRSVGAQIAESWGKRDYVKHFQSKLADAQSENFETQHWLITAVDSGYIPSQAAREIFKISNGVGAMLRSMIEKAAQFCPNENSNKIAEESVEFFNSPKPPFT